MNYCYIMGRNKKIDSVSEFGMISTVYVLCEDI